MQARWDKTQEDSLVSYGAALKSLQDTFTGELVMRSHDLAAALDHLSMRFASLQNDLEWQRQTVGVVNQDLSTVSAVSIDLLGRPSYV